MWLNIRRFLRAPTRLRTLLLALPPRIRRSSVGLRTGRFEINIELWPVYAVHLEFRSIATTEEAKLFKRLQSERKEHKRRRRRQRMRRGRKRIGPKSRRSPKQITATGGKNNPLHLTAQNCLPLTSKILNNQN